MKKLLLTALTVACFNLGWHCGSPDKDEPGIVSKEEYTDENGTYILHIEYEDGTVTHIEVTEEAARNWTNL